MLERVLGILLRQDEQGAVRSTAGRGEAGPAMTKMMPASHEALAQRVAVAAAANARWREIDAAPPAKAKPKPPPRPATAAKPPPAKPQPAKQLPEGSMVLSPDEVMALDALLTSLGHLPPLPKPRKR